MGTRDLLLDIGRRAKGKLAFEELDQVSLDEAWVDEQRAAAARGDDLARRIGGFLDDPLASAVVPWAASWAEHGNPRVAVGPRLAASLMATTMTPENAARVRLPWRAMLIELPEALLFGGSAPGTREAMRLVLVWTFSTGEVGVRVLSEARRVWAIRSCPFAELGEALEDARGMGPRLPSIEKRSLLLVRRVVLGVAASLDAGEGTKTGKARVAAQQKPETDCRDAVRAFVMDARGAAPALLRGHWKRAADGWRWAQPRMRADDEVPSSVAMRVIKSRASESGSPPARASTRPPRPSGRPPARPSARPPRSPTRPPPRS